MLASVSQLFDPKLRAARKSAHLRVREAKKLLRRASGAATSDTQNAVRAAMAAVTEARRNSDVTAMQRTSDRLAALVSEHLEAYRKPPWRESLESIGIAVLVALILRSFVLEAFKIPSGSMIPTLAIGDQIFVNKYLYGVRVPFTSIRVVDFAMPKRGEVIVFICPVEPYEDYIKRVIGLPGDEIAVRGGTIFVNGEPVKRTPLGRTTHWDRDNTNDRWHPFDAMAFRETLGEHEYTVLQDSDQPARDYGPVVVPGGHVFMMGDNRDHSYDSRSWGPVPLQNILGRSMFVWWSWGKDGLEVGRIGTWIE